MIKFLRISAPPGKLLRISAVLTIVALALMVWSMLAPTPLPVMLAMSLGQVLGTAAFGLYGFVILQDLRRVRRARRDSLHHIETADVVAASDARHAAEAAAASDAKPAAEAVAAADAKPAAEAVAAADAKPTTDKEPS